MRTNIKILKDILKCNEIIEKIAERKPGQRRAVQVADVWIEDDELVSLVEETVHDFYDKKISILEERIIKPTSAKKAIAA